MTTVPVHPGTFAVLLPCLVAATTLLAPTAGAAEAERHALRLEPSPLPPLAASTSGGFVVDLAGMTVLAAGGAPGSADGLTLRIFILDAAASWQETDLRVPAWSATAVVGPALYGAGGFADGRPTSRVFRLQRSGDGVTLSDLPPLPVAVAGAGAAALGERLFVFGGLMQSAPVGLGNALWSLELANPGAGWRAEQALPGPGRAFSAVAAQNNVLHVFGGAAAGPDGRLLPLDESWVFRLRPREGTLAIGWQTAARMPVAVAGAKALPLGQAQVMLAGGAGVVPFARTTPAAGWSPLLYHTVTDSWAATDASLEVESPLLLAAGGNGVRVIGTAGGTAAPAVAGRDVTFVRSARKLALLDFAVIGAYFVTVVGVGFHFSRRQKSGVGYALGNRNMKWWAAGMSMFATGASAISFMAIPAQVFSSNLIWLLPLAAQFLAFPVQGWVIFPLLRRLEITSTFEYLERRFNSALRLIASGQNIIFQTFARMTIVMVLPALALSATTGIPVLASVLIMGLVTTLYTSLGGISAVIWTDVLQGTLMLATPLFVIVTAITHVPGGWSGFVATGMEYHKFNLALVTWDVALPAFWLLLLQMFLQWTVQIAGDQPMIQKIFASPVRDIRRTAGMLLFCGAIIAISVQAMGVSIFSYFHHHPAALEPAVSNDQIVPFFIVQKLPVGVAGLVIAAIFAAAVSTLSGTTISVATLAEQDFFLRFRPHLSERGKVRVLRYGSYTVGLVGTGLAAYLSTLDVRSIWDLWNTLAALLGGGVVGVYTLGMFTRRANAFGAIGGALLSIGVTAAVRVFTPFHWAAYLPIAIGTCVLGGYLLSLLRPQRKDLTGLTVFTPAARH